MEKQYFIVSVITDKELTPEDIEVLVTNKEVKEAKTEVTKLQGWKEGEVLDVVLG